MDSKIDWQQIEGSTRKRTHLLASWETGWIKKWTPRIPSFIETYHLTWSSIFSSLIVLGSSWLARESSWWLLLTSFGVLVHYITDALDGEVGRQRKTGLIKWGFYVDHFLDFIFASSVVIGYAFIFPENFVSLLMLLLVICGYFFNAVLECVALGSFRSDGYFGFSGTEMAFGVILFNLLLILTGGRIPRISFSIVLAINALNLIRRFYITQRILWEVDMKAKKASRKK